MRGHAHKKLTRDQKRNPRLCRICYDKQKEQDDQLKRRRDISAGKEVSNGENNKLS